MIFTTIKIHGLPHKHREILQTVKGLADRMSQVDGCSVVDIYRDLDDKNIFYLQEEWKTKQDLEIYKKSNHLSVLMGLKAFLVESIEIRHSVKYKFKNL